MDFRKDINGLRALAVIPVVLFHFNSNWLPGAFAGVDIFFVISGFLMTKIIFQGFNSNFSLFDFYINRVTRIFPVIAALCVCILLFGWFYLSASEYRLLGKHVASTLVFLSNIIYWTESGYFTPAAKENWLLHTWSLSVEWQFYLLYPLILIMLKQFLTLSQLKLFLIVSTIVGYIFCGVVSNIWPSGAFYLLPARVWEFMLGGLAFLYPFQLARKSAMVLEIVGLLLIFAFYLFAFGVTVWPGYYSIVPVLGTFLVIQAARNDSIVTDNIIFQKIGLWSYSIYIWHWPIAVYIYDTGYSIERACLGMFISILLGFISYQLIEKRRTKEKPEKTIKAFVLFKPHLYMACFASFATFVYLTDGVNKPYRQSASSPESIYIDQYRIENYFNEAIWKKYRLECDFYDLHSKLAKAEGIANTCLDAAGKGGVFLWGDSHAQALSYGLRTLLPGHIPFHQIASSGCRALLTEDGNKSGEGKKACAMSREKALESLQTINPDIIIMAQAKEHDITNFNESVRALRERGITSRIFLIGPVPQWRPSLPKAIAKRHLDKTKLSITDTSLVTDFLTVDRLLSEKYRDAELEYISLIEELCEGERCLAKVDGNNTPLHWDYGHLTPEGSVYVVERIIYHRIKAYLKPNLSE